MAVFPYLKSSFWISQVALIVLCTGVSVQAQSSGKTFSERPIPSAYQKWLDEDVLWIIAQEERTSFLRLTKDEERYDFVKQFWQRRYPISASARNEYKEERYRRLAYVNTHFPGTVAGYRTDRGRIYILYGSPDATKAESSRTLDGSLKKTVFWHYRSIPEFGGEIHLKFVDGCNCGDYRLETLPKN